MIRDAIVQDFLGDHPGSEGRQALRDKLRPVLEESFEARQRLQHAELDGLRRRLAEIEQAVAAREKNKEVIVNTRLDSLLLGMSGGGEVITKTVRVPAAAQLPNGSQNRITLDPPSAAAAPGAIGVPLTVLNPQVVEAAQASASERSGADSEAGLDLETRERLAQVDLQEAKNELDAAEKQLKRSRQLHKTGAATQSRLDADERDLHRAKAELDRAEVKVEGLARQRAERESSAQAPEAATNERGETAPETRFDFETRERLAQLDLQEAEANRDAAQFDLDRHRDGNKQAPGSTPKAEMKMLELKLHLAEVQLQRAKVQIEGLARQRTELKGSAEAAVTEAEAEQQKAAAKVRICQAEFEAAEALVGERRADVESAQVTHDYRAKVFERIKNLVAQRGLEQRLADESEQNLAEAKASLAAAKAALVTATANVRQYKAAIDEARAALNVAEARLGTAKAHRDRLLHRAAAEKATEGKPGIDPNDEGNNSSTN
ncbi:MAG TPA: hypothetical protein VNH11_16805 [Pirellulales bacterium]|nr:hypothetical protein [Pirellulales bacterium]